MVSTQYPDTLLYNAAPVTDAVQDSNGDWVKPETAADNREIPCRIEPTDSSGRLIISADGQQQYLSFLVYLPAGTETIPEGTQVELIQGGKEKGKWITKRFHEGRFNCRLWL